MTSVIFLGDCRSQLAYMPTQSVHVCVTSPPYYKLRDYGHGDQIGAEKTPEAFILQMVEVFREVRRVLRDDGTLFLVLGDSYGPSKQLLGIPWRVALALQGDGWYLRQDVIWHKPNPMPESVKDRFTRSHEYVFFFSKSQRYYFDAKSVEENAVCFALPGRGMTNTKKTYGAKNGGNSGLLALRNRLRDQGVTDPKRNRRSVWTVVTQAFKGAHFATFPPALIEPCIMVGSPPGGLVLDPFGGAGTTGLVAEQLGRDSFLIELNPEYAIMAANRIGPSASLI